MTNSAITKPKAGTYVACVAATHDDIDLIVGKIYRVHKPERNDPLSMLRIIDESQEDYLYPIDWFEPMDVPMRVKLALAGTK